MTYEGIIVLELLLGIFPSECDMLDIHRGNKNTDKNDSGDKSSFMPIY